MKKSEEELLKRELGETWTELKSFALECLEGYCRAAKPRLDDTAKMYAKEVVDELGVPADDDRAAYLDKAMRRVEELITDNEMKLRRLTDETDWDHALLVAIAAAVKKYGNSEILGREMKDWIQDAALQFVERSRHMRADRKIKLTSWLVQSARSNINHALRDAKKRPQESFETYRPPKNLCRAGSEEFGDAADDPPEEDDDDADHDRHRPAHHAFNSTGVRSNARLHPSSAR